MTESAARKPLAEAVGQAIDTAKHPADPLTPKQVAAGPDPWESLGAETKIERLRMIVRQQDKYIAELREFVGELLRHQHGADGRMVVPMGFSSKREKEPDPAKAWL